MPTIGSFRQDDLFGQEGILETPTLKAKIKFVPLRERSEKPDYRILAGKREIGAAWSRTAKNGGAYLFLKLADPSQPAPVCSTCTGTRAVPPSSGPADPDGPGLRRGFSRLAAESGPSTSFLAPRAT
jgi:uncharacterized protein (DUF736 family)